MQLNEPILLEQLRVVGFSQERAQEVLKQHADKGWHFNTKIEGLVVVQVFKPRASTPIVTATELPELYKKLAHVWKEELMDPRPKGAPRPRYTRQQQRAAADLEDRQKKEGLNDIQLKQMRDMMSEMVKPLADQQQQQSIRLEQVAFAQIDMKQTCEQLKQVVPAFAAICAGNKQALFLQPGAAAPTASTV